MTVTRKNTARPVIVINQKNGIDYIFLIILLLYLFIFLATVQCKATDTGKKSANVTRAIVGHGSIDKLLNVHEKKTAVA
jgi:hypothetical protein